MHTRTPQPRRQKRKLSDTEPDSAPKRVCPLENPLPQEVWSSDEEEFLFSRSLKFDSVRTSKAIARIGLERALDITDALVRERVRLEGPMSDTLETDIRCEEDLVRMVASIYRHEF